MEEEATGTSSAVCLENAGGERATTLPAMFIPFNLQVPEPPFGI